MTWDKGSGINNIISQDVGLKNDWHVASGIYDNQTDPTKWKCTLYHNGQLQDEKTDDVDAGDFPVQTMNYKRISIGGGPGAYGGGQIENTNQYTSTNGVHEVFVFDDALSTQRNGQMNAYLCDRLNLDLSSSFEYSQFAGDKRGAKGAAFEHASLTNPITGSVAARQYQQWKTTAPMITLQHETAAGCFAGYGLDGGVYYNPKSTKAISLRMWVRATNLNHANHDGSHAALIAKASSPWGHKMDHIKGYALKFGTFNNGADTGDAPSFRLSLRNSDRWTDGETTGGFSDIAVTNNAGGTPANITTPAIDTWYCMRLDIVPYGNIYDQIKAYVSTGTTWYQLGKTQTIRSESKNYRHWFDNPIVPTGHNVNNGIYNGYYVAMSSSTGTTITTSYYIDRFELRTDSVQ